MLDKKEKLLQKRLKETVAKMLNGKILSKDTLHNFQKIK